MFGKSPQIFFSVLYCVVFLLSTTQKRQQIDYFTAPQSWNALEPRAQCLPDFLINFNNSLIWTLIQTPVFLGNCRKKKTKQSKSRETSSVKIKQQPQVCLCQRQLEINCPALRAGRWRGIDPARWKAREKTSLSDAGKAPGWNLPSLPQPGAFPRPPPGTEGPKPPGTPLAWTFIWAWWQWRRKETKIDERAPQINLP